MILTGQGKRFDLLGDIIIWNSPDLKSETVKL